MLCIWFAFLGGCVGSFANVVVWRMPQGMSISRPPSHCPKCGHPIRWYHNLPVVGWFALRGKCADCREPIAVRYPLVEAITAAFFLAAAVYMRSGWHAAFDQSLTTTVPFLTVAARTLLIALIPTTLLVILLIRFDRQRIPKRIVIFLALLVIIAGMIY